MSQTITAEAAASPSIGIASPSICIPRLHATTSKARVLNVMRHVLGPGCIRDIELIRRGDKDLAYCRAFIHLTGWPDMGQGAAVRKRLLEGKQVYIACRGATLWRCSAAYGRTGRPGNNAGFPEQHNVALS